MQIPSKSFEAIGYCLLSVKSNDNKYSISEIDVSGMSDTTSDTMSDSSSNVLSISHASSAIDLDLSVSGIDLDLSVSGIDFDIDISDIDISDIDTFYIEKKQLPNVIIEIHEEKNMIYHLDFCEFFRVVSTIIELFVFEEASYLFDIFG
uniref:Uncharacterized protein n=1 Tax=viral metagenome TaxID=1070528 RepID=A0A6C0E639_9ZZZZ